MINPVAPFFEFFLAIWANLPVPIVNLVSLSLGLVLVSAIFLLVYRIRS